MTQAPALMHTICLYIMHNVMLLKYLHIIRTFVARLIFQKYVVIIDDTITNDENIIFRGLLQTIDQYKMECPCGRLI